MYKQGISKNGDGNTNKKQTGPKDTEKIQLGPVMMITLICHRCQRCTDTDKISVIHELERKRMVNTDGGESL